MVDFGAVSISTFSDCWENKMTSFAPSFASPVCFRFHFHPSCFGLNFMSSLAFTSLGLACLKFFSSTLLYNFSTSYYTCHFLQCVEEYSSQHFHFYHFLLWPQPVICFTGLIVLIFNLTLF